jgi:hypothetical protein
MPAAAPAADDPGKFKLKPRGAAPAAAVSVPVVAAPVAAGTPVAPPVVQSAGVIPVLRLSAAAPAAAAVPAQPLPPGSVPIVKPTLPAAALASPAFAKPAGPNSGRPNMPIAPLPPSGPVAIPTGGTGPRPQGKMVAQTDEKAVARGKFAVKLLAALLFVAAGLGGVVAYNLWFAGEAAPAPVVAKPAPVPASTDVPAVAPTDASTAPAVVGDTPAVATPPSSGPVVVDNPQSLPGQMIAKAQNAVAAHDAAMTQPANEVLDTTASSVPAAVTPASVEVKPVPAPEPVVVPRPEPGANFKAFVVNLKINGVFQGENARAMLNGKMYRLGEVVDAKLGIVFVRLEPEDKRIVFEDSRGAIMSRRY